WTRALSESGAQKTPRVVSVLGGNAKPDDTGPRGRSPRRTRLRSGREDRPLDCLAASRQDGGIGDAAGGLRGCSPPYRGFYFTPSNRGVPECSRHGECAHAATAASASVDVK